MMPHVNVKYFIHNNSMHDFVISRKRRLVIQRGDSKHQPYKEAMV
jgi:hypothetical protein